MVGIFEERVVQLGKANQAEILVLAELCRNATLSISSNW